MPISLPPDEHLILSYSGGKESLTILDLLTREGRKVTAFHLYFLPGLDFTQYVLDHAARHFPSVTIHLLPQMATADLLRSGTYCDRRYLDLPKYSLSDAAQAIRHRSGARWVGYGYRSQDSLWRRGELAHWRHGLDWHRCLFAPLKNWSEREVLSYLNLRRLTAPGNIFSQSANLPDAEGKVSKRKMGDVGINRNALYKLKQHFPRDVERIREVFNVDHLLE